MLNKSGLSQSVGNASRLVHALLVGVCTVQWRKECAMLCIIDDKLRLLRTSLYKSNASAWPKRNCRFFAEIISCFLAFALIWHLSNWIMFIATNRFLLSAFYGLILNLLRKIMALSVDDSFQDFQKYQMHRYEFIYLRSGNFRMKIWCLKFPKEH